MSSPSFRGFLSNATDHFSQKSINEVSYRIGRFWDKSIAIAEEFPLYVALSYLLVTFVFKFAECLIDEFNPPIETTKSAPEVSMADRKSHANLIKGIYDIPSPRSRSQAVNHNTEYIKVLFRHRNPLVTLANSKIVAKHNPGIDLLTNESSSIKSLTQFKSTSYLLKLFEDHIYKHVPHMKYSKQFINTYTVAFMVVYFFTLYGLKVSDMLSRVIVKFLYLLFKFVLSDFKPFFSIDTLDFHTEFSMTCIATSAIVTGQLLLSIGKFRTNLLHLHMGEHLFSAILLKEKRASYAKVIQKSNKAFKKITVDSLHFSGYFIAYQVYGYFLTFLGVFCVMILLEFVYFLPRGFMYILQILLPLGLIIFFKYLLAQLLSKVFIVDRKNTTLYKIGPYYIVSYFYFFFDCFIGIATCMSRATLTQVTSMLTLARIDIPMFSP